MMSSFWAEGPKRLREALHARRAELDSLAAQIGAATDADERERLQREVKRILEEYEPSAHEIDQCLFLLR